MIDPDEMFEIERKLFIKEMKIPANLSYKKKDDYFFGIRKAFDDAFNQYARRKQQKYANEKEELISPIVERIFDYLNNNNDIFDECYNCCIEKAKRILNNNQYGIAQKFINMSFKYMMCFCDSDYISEKFNDCYLPLDKYTIKWIRARKNKEINKRLDTIKNAWANIDEELYKDIQNYVKTELLSTPQYKVSYSEKAGNNEYCSLSSNRLKTEFIIWHQEKINEIHRILEKAIGDFERLGIQKI